MIKQGHKLNAEEKRLLKAKGIAVSQKASPGPGRPLGSSDRVKAAVIATGGIETLNAKGWEIKEVGRAAVLEKLAEESCLTKCLDATFGEEMTSDILARSIFLLARCSKFAKEAPRTLHPNGRKTSCSVAKHIRSILAPSVA